MSEPPWRQPEAKTSELNDVWAALFKMRDAVADLESKLTHLDKQADDDRGAQPSSESPQASTGAAKALALTEAGRAAQAPHVAPRAKTGGKASPGTRAECPSCGRVVVYDVWWDGKLCLPCFRAWRADR